RRAAAPERAKSRPDHRHPPHRHRWLVDGDSPAGVMAGVRGRPAKSAVAPGPPAHSIRRLRAVAKTVAAGRKAERAGHLLALPADWSAPPAQSAHRPAPPQSAKLAR